MTVCRHTTRPCDNPHLACRACPVQAKAEAELRGALVRRKRGIRIPDVVPYVAIRDHGGINNAIEIGIKGRF